jgi:hypothetical protein
MSRFYSRPSVLSSSSSSCNPFLSVGFKVCCALQHSTGPPPHPTAPLCASLSVMQRSLRHCLCVTAATDELGTNTSCLFRQPDTVGNLLSLSLSFPSRHLLILVLQCTTHATKTMPPPPPPPSPFPSNGRPTNEGLFFLRSCQEVVL